MPVLGQVLIVVGALLLAVVTARFVMAPKAPSSGLLRYRLGRALGTLAPTIRPIAASAFGTGLFFAALYFFFPEWFWAITSSSVFWPAVVGCLIVTALRTSSSEFLRSWSVWLFGLIIVGTCYRIASEQKALHPDPPAPVVQTPQPVAPVTPPAPKDSTHWITPEITLDTLIVSGDSAWSAWPSSPPSRNWFYIPVPNVKHEVQTDQGREYKGLEGGRGTVSLWPGFNNSRLRFRSVNGVPTKIVLVASDRFLILYKAPPKSQDLWSELIVTSSLRELSWRSLGGEIRVRDFPLGDEHPGNVPLPKHERIDQIQFQAVGSDTVIVAVARP